MADWETVDEFGTVNVLRSHIEKWVEQIQLTRGYHAALDLSENYRQGRPNAAYSKLTRQLERIVQQMEGYLNTEQEESS